MTFAPGVSGNPLGRTRGSKNTSTRLRAKLSKGLPSILNKLTSLALEGDTAAMKMVLDRVLPTLRPVSAAVTIPGVMGDSLADRAGAVLAAVTEGKMPPDTGAMILSALASTAKALELADLMHRIAALEAKNDA